MGRKRRTFMNRRNVLKALTGNDYIFTILTKVFAVLIGLIATSFSARYLGPALKGELAPIQARLTIVAVILNFGLYQPYPYHKRLGEPDALNKFLRIFMLQFLVYSVVGAGLAAAFDDFALGAICLIAPIQVLANQLSFMIMVEDVKFKNVTVFTARVTNTLIIILAYVGLRWFKPTLLVPLGMVVVGDLITVVMTLVRLKTFPNPFKADFKFLRRIFGFGVVAMLTTLMLSLNYRVDILMLDAFRVAKSEIGLYEMGISLAEYGWLIPDAFREVLFSRTAKDDAIEDLTFSMKVNFYITLFIIAFIALFGRLALRIIGGAAFVPAYGITLILLFGILSMSYFKLIGTLLLAQGKKFLYMGLLGVSVAANIIMNLLAIPALGKEGAALASVVSYTIAGAVFLVYFVRSYNVPLRKLFVFEKGEIRGLFDKVRGKFA